MTEKTAKSQAWRFIILLGLVSLFADMTYEGARGIAGPYLLLLGASGTAVGFAAGAGELIGYGLRLVSGWISDKTRRYWLITISGYTLNLLAVPLLALAGRWEIAIALLILERTGKAIRSPARDAMLSHATAEVGHGWGFGFHEAMDQIGATLGPLIIAFALYAGKTHRFAFALLAIPALCALAALGVARFQFPLPEKLEVKRPVLETAGFSRRFWIYVAAASLVGAAFADFPLVAYHFQKEAIAGPAWIPIFYATAMGIDAVAALVLGRLFDRLGLRTVAWVTLVSAFFAPLVFLGGFRLALLGMAFWGIGMGAQESIMRAAVASMVPSYRRATAFGILNMSFGLAWFGGSVLMGFLYDRSIPLLVAFSIGLQLIAVPLFLAVGRIADSGSTSRPE